MKRDTNLNYFSITAIILGWLAGMVGGLCIGLIGENKFNWKALPFIILSVFLYILFFIILFNDEKIAIRSFNHRRRTKPKGEK